MTQMTHMGMSQNPCRLVAPKVVDTSWIQKKIYRTSAPRANIDINNILKLMYRRIMFMFWTVRQRPPTVTRNLAPSRVFQFPISLP